MDFRQFFRLQGASWNAFRAETDDNAKLDARGVFQGLWTPSEPIVWRHYMDGAVPRDLVPTGFVGLFLVSDRVVEVLRTHQFTGWSPFPVTLLGKQKEVIPGYHAFAVTGRCGTPDVDR